MANLDFENVIKDFSTYFGIRLKNLSFSFDNKIPVVEIQGRNEPVKGLRNLVNLVSKSENPEIEAIQEQWIEYAAIYLGNSEQSSSNQLLKDLNDYMVDKVYFVGHSLGPVDILMYYLLHNIMAKLTFQEKEKYLNTSRWIQNIQHKKDVRLWRSIIPFSRSCLYF